MSHVKVELLNRVLSITLSRPEKKNAISRDMYEDMAHAIGQVKHNQEIALVLFKGEGDCFTAGNDMQEFASVNAGLELRDNTLFMQALLECEVPVIAQVQGMAVGIGCTMLLHCDLVYCSPETRFVLPFINLALVPEFASSYLLPKLAGHRKASQWLMLGEPFAAHEAEQCGLVSQIVEAKELNGFVETVVAKLLTKPQYALRQTKQLMKSEQAKIQLHMKDELDIFSELLVTEAAQECFNAFLQKRKPDQRKLGV
jgi:enoyl-CoA hydratase/carnithine racemase